MCVRGRAFLQYAVETHCRRPARRVRHSLCRGSGTGSVRKVVFGRRFAGCDRRNANETSAQSRFVRAEIHVHGTQDTPQAEEKSCAGDAGYGCGLVYALRQVCADVPDWSDRKRPGTFHRFRVVHKVLCLRERMPFIGAYVGKPICACVVGVFFKEESPCRFGMKTAGPAIVRARGGLCRNGFNVARAV